MHYIGTKTYYSVYQVRRLFVFYRMTHKIGVLVAIWIVSSPTNAVNETVHDFTLSYTLN